ncbi:uncharacterized protein TNIN_247521 [Trichonephila inaurata madagascariensis]|uniref:Uncharacterized protein n=1 Tax=Trichonephila inaurata madagascariensis TaxID=2747483 RepID=A0A8X6WV47_9ARAC|nr:uncharacterized protein TNIN_247521 [Trichonephila inaurata madagascariensis]
MIGFYIREHEFLTQNSIQGDRRGIVYHDFLTESIQNAAKKDVILEKIKYHGSTLLTVQAMEKSIFHPSVVYTVSILSDDQRTDQDTFVDTFVQLVYKSDILKDLFDLSETPAIEFAGYVHKHFVPMLASLGARNPEKIADFATRPMAQNFKLFTREEMVRVYSSVAASYLYSQGILIQDNAKDLANQYANTFEKSANETVVENDPTSKFKAIGNGLMEFLMSKDTLTVEKPGWEPFITKANGF